MPDLEASEIEYLVYSLSLGRDDRSRHVLRNLAQEFYGGEALTALDGLS